MASQELLEELFLRGILVGKERGWEGMFEPFGSWGARVHHGCHMHGPRFKNKFEKRMLAIDITPRLPTSIGGTSGQVIVGGFMAVGLPGCLEMHACVRVGGGTCSQLGVF